MNQVNILGRLGRDPVDHTFPDGNRQATLSIATDDVWTDKDGKRQTKTQWHQVVLRGKNVENVMKYVKKGTQVSLTGKLEHRNYVDKEEITRYVTEIITTFVRQLDNFNKVQDDIPPAQPNGKVVFIKDESFDDELEEEIPF